MALSMRTLLVAVAALVLALVGAAASTTPALAAAHKPVAIKWTLPMASKAKSGKVGTYVFSWKGSLPHDLVQVSQSDFNACTKSGSSKSLASATLAASVKVSLTTPGTYYFICSVPGHCAGGQKIALTVA